jgi:hypothetical protein
MSRVMHLILLLTLLTAGALGAQGTPPPSLVLPQNRSALYAQESLELAVAGLAPGAAASVELVPQEKRLTPLRFDVRGDGSTVTVRLPPFALAPGTYTLGLDGKPAGKLTVASGVVNSSMLLSQTGGDLDKGAGNFIVGNAAGFGLLGPDGQPSRSVRGQRSGGLQYWDGAVAQNRPTILYQYWTGYTFHKPWGPEKSWAGPDETEAMRLMTLHVAQQLRARAKNLAGVGTIDEPGLSWGRTPAGHDATGYPNWDEQAYYEKRGWSFTDNPASRPDSDWMKYLTLRCGIIKEAQGQAKQDWQTVIPGVAFSTDLYAPTAIMDGTDPLNQEVNDIPTSHVFDDFYYGKLGIIGGLYLEKAHDPLSKVAHAMNGQLVGKPVPQPQQRATYHLMLNALLAGGIQSNWWLNTGGMTDADLAAVNEPGQRLGPLFLGMNLGGHDVAVLWGFTELAMREKAPTARAATLKEANADAYRVGENYTASVLAAHQALSRAGYPAHVVHEKLLPRGILKNYRALVVIGQTFAFPPDVQKAIAEFQAGGGSVVVDRSTTLAIPGALVTEGDFKEVGRRQAEATPKPAPAKPDKTSAYVESNFFKDEWARKGAPLVRETMARTKARPAFTSDSVFLAGERHQGGQGALYMVLNGYEKLPEIGAEEVYYPYNYAPLQATYTLGGIKPGSAVYRIEGLDWKTVTRVEDASRPQTGSFQPGEMKLYLVAPRAPSGLAVSAQAKDGALTVAAGLKGLKMPWPLALSVKDPDGTEIYHVYRATDAGGRYAETFPLGTNARPGTYRVSVESPAGSLTAQAKPQVQAAPAAPTVLGGSVRVFDEAAIRAFLGKKPAVTIAIGSPAQRPAAEKLASALGAKGIQARVAPEAEVFRKARYPRVWDPYVSVYEATGEEKKPTGEVKTTLALEMTDDGRTVARTSDGKDVGEEWQKPETLVSVTGKGFAHMTGIGGWFYEPGVKLYVNKNNQVEVVKGTETRVKTSEEVRRKWSRPWARLGSYQGTYYLGPQLPEAYQADAPLILLGDSKGSELVAALQASELLPQVADEQYPGPGKALLSFAWSPFGLGKDVVLVGASDEGGLSAGAAKLIELLPR